MLSLPSLRLTNCNTSWVEQVIGRGLVSVLFQVFGAEVADLCSTQVPRFRCPLNPRIESPFSLTVHRERGANRKRVPRAVTRFHN